MRVPPTAALVRCSPAQCRGGSLYTGRRLPQWRAEGQAFVRGCRGPAWSSEQRRARSRGPLPRPSAALAHAARDKDPVTPGTSLIRCAPGPRPVHDGRS